jgi:hypothetical protein
MFVVTLVFGQIVTMSVLVGLFADPFAPAPAR